MHPSKKTATHGDAPSESTCRSGHAAASVRGGGSGGGEAPSPSPDPGLLPARAPDAARDRLPLGYTGSMSVTVRSSAAPAPQEPGSPAPAAPAAPGRSPLKYDEPWPSLDTLSRPLSCMRGAPG